MNSFWVSAQNEQLALQYFDDGEFEKALTIFEENLQKQPSNYFFFQKKPSIVHKFLLRVHNNPKKNKNTHYR